MIPTASPRSCRRRPSRRRISCRSCGLRHSDKPSPVWMRPGGASACRRLAGDTMELTMPKSRLELLREIALYMGAQRVMLDDGGTRREILVDSLTARAVLRVHSLIPEKERSQFMAMPWTEMIKITRERLPLAC